MERPPENIEELFQEHNQRLTQLEEQSHGGGGGLDIDPLVAELLKRLAETQTELTKLETDAKDAVSAHDAIRNLLYVDWDHTDFDPKDAKTYPPCLKKSKNILEALDKLSKGISYAHRMVIEYRYPEFSRKTEPIQPAKPTPETQERPNPPVVVTQGNAAQDMTRVRSVWTGWWEARIAKMELESRERLAVQQRKIETPRILSNNVVRDPIEMGNEFIAVLNETKGFYSDCLLQWPRRRNRYFALSVHSTMRERFTKLLTVVESFIYVATALQQKEIMNNLIAQTSHFTRIIEAYALGGVSIQQFTRPYSRDGYSDRNLFDRRTPSRG